MEGQPLQLQPGDRRIQGVRPLFGVEARSASHCARCGRRLLEDRTWRVDYGEGRSNTVTFDVCGECARELTPRRLTIDLAALRLREVPDDLVPLARLVDYILLRRTRIPTQELQLRSSDVHLLSETYGTSTAQFVMRLRDEGLLVGL